MNDYQEYFKPRALDFIGSCVWLWKIVYVLIKVRIPIRKLCKSASDKIICLAKLCNEFLTVFIFLFPEIQLTVPILETFSFLICSISVLSQFV